MPLESGSPDASGLPGLDPATLEEWLNRGHPGLLAGPVSARWLSGGRSNLTYAVTDGRSCWVLRRPPLGHVLETAHDMGREFRVLSALHGTDVPVPRPVLLADAEAIGAPFYLMEQVEGTVLRERADLEALAGSGLGAARADELVDVLARLHRVDPAAVGLADLGRPEGYLARQVRRWAGQLAASRSRDLPRLTLLGERLAAALPASGRSAVVHGDYRLDNVLVAGDRIAAVLDWEMATLGDPLTDLASLLLWWDGLRGLDSPVAAVPGDVPGLPQGRDLVEVYARRTGLDLSGLPWYLGFAFYKVAAIFEGIHYRERQGLTVGDGFDRLGALVPDLVERGHAALDERL